MKNEHKNASTRRRLGKAYPKIAQIQRTSRRVQLPVKEASSVRGVVLARHSDIKRSASGGMAEWLKAHAWKACIRETVSWVRIPLPPPRLNRCYITIFSPCGFPCKPSVRFEEFRLGNSPVRPKTNSLLEICGKHRANSPFGVSPVRLCDVD